jgi:hypothetical protein
VGCVAICRARGATRGDSSQLGTRDPGAVALAGAAPPCRRRPPTGRSGRRAWTISSSGWSRRTAATSRAIDANRQPAGGSVTPGRTIKTVDSARQQPTLLTVDDASGDSSGIRDHSHGRSRDVPRSAGGRTSNLLARPGHPIGRMHRHRVPGHPSGIDRAVSEPHHHARGPEPGNEVLLVARHSGRRA